MNRLVITFYFPQKSVFTQKRFELNKWILFDMVKNKTKNALSIFFGKMN